jgi:hypothetical protein
MHKLLTISDKKNTPVSEACVYYKDLENVSVFNGFRALFNISNNLNINYKKNETLNNYYIGSCYSPFLFEFDIIQKYFSFFTFTFSRFYYIKKSCIISLYDNSHPLNPLICSYYSFLQQIIDFMDETIKTPFDRWREQLSPLLKQIGAGYDTAILLYKWEQLRDHKFKALEHDSIFIECCYKAVEYGFWSYRLGQRHFKITFKESVNIIRKMEAIGILTMADKYEVNKILIRSIPGLISILSKKQIDLQLNSLLQ